MINLFNRTEYSFRKTFGQMQKILDANPDNIIGICDMSGTWGHVPFYKACKKLGKKMVFGVELAHVDDADLKDVQRMTYIKFLAINNDGLKNLYQMVTASTGKFYYLPRIDAKIIDQFTASNNIIMVTQDKLSTLEGRSNVYVEINPTTDQEVVTWAMANNIPPIASSDNFYPRPSDKTAYEICSGSLNKETRSTPMHILNEYEWDFHTQLPDDYKKLALENSIKVANMCNAELPHASLVKPKVDMTLLEMCEKAAPERGIDLTNGTYRQRLDREIALIAEKEFEDYFFIIADLLKYAKQHMLVGPARGSSCGSLVCYLLRITEIDPIPYDLLFERFIDINRKDLPDIDIDFPDTKRHMILTYLKEKYGEECVCQLGTVLRYKAKSTITDVSKELGIPLWEVTDLKNAIIERSGGDSRAAFCILDTFDSLDIGKTTLAKFPELAISAEIENHAKTTGTHAAAILVTELPVTNYCSVDLRLGATQVDKYDAESLNLLKIDALGLRTLTLIEDCLEQVGWSYEKILKYPTDDKAAFEILNSEKFNGIFQFEGYALQSLCHQLRIENFEDMVSLTALGRPGPLNSGGATEFLKRRMGEKEVEYLHPLAEDITKVTYGTIVYQEQVMQIARIIGKLSWEDVSSLRKAMSKSLGKEFFDQFWIRFEQGANSQGITSEQAKIIWDNINTMGSWSFNRSHAVAYGLLSYWCCVLKAHFPLEYAAACLRNPATNDQMIKILREIDKDGYKYIAFDKDKSQENWTIQDRVLVGGLVGVKGVAGKIAKEIIKRKKEGKELSPSHIKRMNNAVTPYDMLYECHERFGDIFENPTKYNISSKLTFLKDITSEDEGVFCFIAKLTEKNLRDGNELVNLEKRGGVMWEGQTLFLNFTVEDDTSSMMCQVSRYSYLKWGKKLVEEGVVGDWYIFKGKQRKGFRKIYIDRWRKLRKDECSNP